MTLIGSTAKVTTVWEVEHRRGGVLLSRTVDKNTYTDQGLNHTLDVLLHGATQINPWYVIIVETNTTATAGMTYAVPVFTECTAYDEATRKEYVEAAAASRVTTNSASKAVFTINASKTIYGAALVGGGTGGATKADVAGGGTLLNYSKFTGSKSVVAGDTLTITATVTLTSA